MSFKRKKGRILLFVGMLLVLLAGNAFAVESQFFIRMDGIRGESKEPGYVGCIEVISFTQGVLSEEQLFRFKHVVDKATPDIQAACEKGTLIPTCDLSICVKEDGKLKKVYQISMTNVRVTGAHIEVDPLADDVFRVTETVDIVAERARWIAYDNKPVPKTGDDSPLLLWFLMTAGSCAALLFIRKRNVQQ